MRKLKFIFTCLLITAGIGLSYAQSRTVSGTVVYADDNEPVIGATVVVKGTQTATITGTDGKFTITTTETNHTLVISFIGLKEVETEAKDGMRVALYSKSSELDEVVVTGYGTATKKAFTGSAAVVTSKNIENRQVSDVTKALSGTTSGVQAVSTSGQPGTSATLRIRGVGSISSSSAPLYVVDGIPVESNLHSINSADIESITVLKDAAANSLYGARGANGVVLITTKKGKSGKTQVTLETRFGFNQRAIPAYDVVNDKGQYMELLWESLKNKAIADGNTNPAQWASNNLLTETKGFNPFTNVPANNVVGVDGKLNPNAVAAWNDNWLKDPFRNGPRYEDVVTVSGGNGNTNYYLSFGYLDENSYITASDFKRYTTRAKIEQEVTSWLKVGTNLSYAKVYMNNPWSADSESSYANLFFFAQQNPPIYPIYKYDKTSGQPILDNNGKKQYEFSTPFSPGTNPLSALENDMRDTDYDYTTALGYAEISFLKDFKVKLNIQAENIGYFSNSFQTPIGGDALNVGGRNTRTASKIFSLTAQQQITYVKAFDLHNVDVLVGHETKAQKNNYLTAQKENFLIPTNPELINAGRLLDATSYDQRYSLESYLSRATYDYDEKYFLSASLRYDGSSRFAPESRWGGFWSLGGAWLINKENFLSSVNWINELKVKASYGTQGNDGILDSYGYSLYNLYQDQYAVSPDGSGGVSVSWAIRGNRKLRWEKSNNFNTGIEFEFFDRFFGGIEYYQKTTHDLLYQKPLATSQGLPNWIYDNAISLKNNGIEIELGVDIFKLNDFKWQIKGNLTTQTNKILELPKEKDPDGKGYVYGSYWFKVGGSIYDFYTYRSAGVDPATGKALWYAEDKDDDGNVTGNKTVTEYGEASRYRIGKSAFPSLYGGIESTLSYKGFDFAIQGAYQYGGYGWDTQYQGLMTTMEDASSGAHADVLNRRWTTPGQITDVPRLEYGLSQQNSTSDRFLVSRSYVSINNITLGYTFQKKLTEKISLEKVRLYATCDNVALWSARQGYDPRLYISGAGTYAYGAMRTYSLGLNINF
jgi:TonB-linked SusC/RagA family outer membrane protein